MSLYSLGLPHWSLRQFHDPGAIPHTITCVPTPFVSSEAAIFLLQTFDKLHHFVHIDHFNRVKQYEDLKYKKNAEAQFRRKDIHLTYE